MTAGMEKLRRDYLLPDLKAVTQATGVTGTVVVQARQTIEESFWLSEIAGETKTHSWNRRLGASCPSTSGLISGTPGCSAEDEGDATCSA